MNALFRLFFFLLTAALTALPSVLFSQTVPEIHTHPVFQQIDDALQRGELSIDEAITEKFRYAYSERLDTSEAPIKCMAPTAMQFYSLKNQLSPETVRQVQQVSSCTPPDNSQNHLSPSGNFRLYYTTEGTHAVPDEDANQSGIPDYIERAAFAADSSYRYQVEEAGFVNFLRDEPYEIFFQNINFYGSTYESGSTTCIRIHNNFEGFPSNTHPDGDQTGALYATIAHEIKHAIQFATNRWTGSAGSFSWMEMDATLMEEVVFPDVNDYYNYIKADIDSDQPHAQSIFGTPFNPTPGAYWHITWMIYFYETYGIEFWVDVWDHFVEERNLLFFVAIERELEDRGASLRLEHMVNHLWHLNSGPAQFSDGFGFEDRENYPNPNFAPAEFSAPQDSVWGRTVDPMAANYFRINPSNVSPGQPAFSLSSDTPGVGIGVIGYFRDGTARKEIALNPDSGEQLLQTTWDWSELTGMSVAAINTNQSGSAGYTLRLDSVLPDEDLLAQNYPNPFRESTRIEFSVNASKHVRVEVYDVAGRRLATLLDRTVDAGFHRVEFDGRGLASGVYFYRITTDESSAAKKMMLIR